MKFWRVLTLSAVLTLLAALIAALLFKPVAPVKNPDSLPPPVPRIP